MVLSIHVIIYFLFAADRDEILYGYSRFLKGSIADPSDLSRKRKGKSRLVVWKLNNKHKKERVVLDPVNTG